MTPNPQSPAYALFAQSWLPLPHSKSRTGVIRVNHGVSGPSFDLSCLRIKISRQYEHCTGGVWPTNFERLRETKDLSALACVISLIASFQDIQETILEGSAKFGSHRLEELPRKPRKISSDHGSTVWRIKPHTPPPWRTCPERSRTGHIAGCETTTTHPRTRQFSHGGSPIR
jgi:hypothetical protein